MGDITALRPLLGTAAEELRAAGVSSDAGSGRPPSTTPAAPPVAVKLLDMQSADGYTALHMAAAHGHAKCVEALVAAGAVTEARTSGGLSSLHLAAQSGHIEAVRVLHEMGSSLCAMTDEAETPLHLAVARGHRLVVSYLLRVCDTEIVGIRNRYGQCAAEVCSDLETPQLFCASVGTVDRSGGCAAAGEQDSYARRTAFLAGGVLLRNSRADAVRRLLHRTGAPLPLPSASLPALRGSLGSGGDGVRRRKSFCRLQEEEGIEVVGPSSFQMQCVLGRGSFGEVYKVAHKKTGQVFAMKVLRKSKIVTRNLVRYAMTERNLLSYIRHPFIVRLHYAFQTPSCLVLVLQYCPNGSLSALVSHEGSLPEALARLYVAEVFLAIEHLHERQVVYRDLKPENVVIDELDHAMLTDFGLSKEGVEGERGTRSFCGSVAYLAPEILARTGHGPPVDLYGLGVLLYEVLAGHPPFYSRDREQLFRNIAGATLHAPAGASAEAAKLICALMQRDPARRPGATRTSDLREHPFFAGLDFERVLRREVPVPPVRSAGGSVITSPGKAAGGEACGEVANPFEGRLEAQVRKSCSPSAQDLPGWEFATPEPRVTIQPSWSEATLPRPGASSVTRESSRKRVRRRLLCFQRRGHAETA